jgi:predicted exporter
MSSKRPEGDFARRLLGPTQSWLTFHPRLALGISLAILALGAGVARMTIVEQDIGAMLPSGPDSPREAARALEEFGALNVLLLDLGIPGSSPGELARAGQLFAARLRALGAFSEVVAGQTTAELLATGRVVFDHRFALLPDPRSAIESRLAAPTVTDLLREVKGKLASPQAIVTKAQLLADPLLLTDGILQQLKGTTALTSYDGQLLSPDRKHLLLIGVTRTSALDTEAARTLLLQLQDEAGNLPVGSGRKARLVAVGGPRFAAESASTVKRDILVTVLTSIVVLLIIFVARFRSLRLLVLASLTVALGTAGGVVAVAVLERRIHPLTFAFGSVLIGIAVDYPMYLFNAAATESGTPPERLSAAIATSGRSLWLGCVTTLMAFGLMLFSGFPGLRELAIFAGAGILCAFAATMTVGIPLGASWGLRVPSPVPGWMTRLHTVRLPPYLAWALLLSGICLSIFAVPRLRFDGDLRHLDAQQPDTVAQYEEVRTRFGLQGSDSLVIARGASREEALQLSDDVGRVLEHAKDAGEVAHVLGLHSILPSIKTQRSRREQLGELDISAARVRLNTSAESVGFESTAFEPFWRAVEDARSADANVLTPKDLDGTALEPLVHRLLRCTTDGCLVATTFEPVKPSTVPELRRQVPPRARVIDGGALAAETVARIPEQLALFSGLGLLSNVLLLVAAFRSVRLALLACAPGAVGLLGTLAILSALNVPLNLVSASALVLILGCGVDYGIFAAQGLTQRRGSSGVEFTGILLTSSTTLAGFGTLSLASYRAIQTLGTAVGFGIGISALVALFIVPHLGFSHEVPEPISA